MPAWYIHIDVARKATANLASNPSASAIFASDGMTAAHISTIAKENPAYVALGAIGPDIFFLLPDFKPPLGSMLWKLANAIRELYTGWDETFLGPYESAMGPIGDNLSDELNALSGGLKATIEGIFTQASALLHDFIKTLILQQYDFFGILSSGVPTGFDEQTFFWADMLHYRQTYRTAAELWQAAGKQTDPVSRDRFRAFALGWMSHLATDVTGHAFVNQKAGGPYRLHWQRHHLVELHMDAQVYNHDHGNQRIYDQMANAALHLWLAFNPDGSSRVNLFAPEPNPPYLTGDHSADIVDRHAKWDFDSDIPDDLAQFLSDTLKKIFTPALTASDGMVACCPTIISSLDGRVPLASKGFAEKDDIVGAYWWLYRFVKFLTTDYYKIRRPVPPEVVVIPSFPQAPGSGDSDPGPGPSADNGLLHDALEFLFSLLAWAEFLVELIVWPAAVIAGIVAGTLTYRLRWALYEAIELPLYNLWLGVHSFLAMTGYVMPMPGELNSGLNTLGVSVQSDWIATVAALNDPDGGITPGSITTDPSGRPRTGNPKDVVLDPPNLITQIFADLFKPGSPSVAGEFPSEFTRPWRFPDTDNGGDILNTEQPQCPSGPFVAGQNATALLGASPGDPAARTEFESAANEQDTINSAASLLPAGKHLGDPVDYSAYVISRLTRNSLDAATVCNFNLDADRGYGYLSWDWVRDKDSIGIPHAFAGNRDPSAGNAFTAVSEHRYPAPKQPGYGWDHDDVTRARAVPGSTGPGFDPFDPLAAVKIRYIDKEPKL